jgi:hypothetical protein
MAGKQVAPEVKGEFSKGNEPLQDLQELSTEVIVDLTEYPEVQRNGLTHGGLNTAKEVAPG